ncbi:hypothetical protein GQ600_17440 [Phytophthora cactorum]|nr:hypothetical protein GQ600_17440 [Phytophthora cactorum]
MLTRKKIGDRACSGAFRELETINGESIAVWLSRAPLQSPICLDALSSQDRMRYLTSMEQRGKRGNGESTFGNVRSAIVYLYTATRALTKKIRLSELRRVMLQVQALRTQDEVTRAHSSTDAAGLLFEQIESRLPFSSTSTKGRGRRLDSCRGER